MKIKFIDFERQQNRISDLLKKNIDLVLSKNSFIMGPQIQELENKLCQFTGARFCTTCSSGTDALLMPLMAWGIGPGDAVFVPAFTFFATAEMPALLGATPIFVDISPQTFLINPELLEKAILRVKSEGKLHPRAIIPVDLFGQPASYELILPFANELHIPVLEDAAQAFGSRRNGKNACNTGCEASATSFFPAKPLGCYGDGGAVFTNNPELAEVLQSIRVHGKGIHKYANVRIGLNGRLDTIQAAVLLAKMEIFPWEIEQRSRVADDYAQNLSGIDGVSTPIVQEGSKSVWAQYCITLSNNTRDKLAKFLAENDIPTNIYYPCPLPALKLFPDNEECKEKFPCAWETSQKILALPFHPYLTSKEIEYICSKIRDFFS